MPTRSDEVLWRAGVPRSYWIVFALLTVGCVVGGLIDGTLRGWADASVWLLVYAIVAVVALVTIWSVHRYNSVTVTTSELRVGREVVPAAALDPASIAPALHAPRPLLRGARPIGGADEEPAGTAMLAVRRRDGTEVVIAVRDVQPFLEALAEQERRLL